MTENPDLTAVIEAWPNLAPDARRMLARLAQDCLDPENAGAFRKTTCLRPNKSGGGVPAAPVAPQPSGRRWPELKPSSASGSAWERHDDPEFGR